MLSHTDVLVDLVRLAWTPCGAGDWAVGLRSPSGLLVARVCPFDPAHAPFLELCRRCAGNPYLPSIALATSLEGGGALTIMEFLAPVSDTLAAETIRHWRDGGHDVDFETLRRAAQAVDERCRASVPWWDGIDLDEGNIGQSRDGRLALYDLFCMDGAALYSQILQDPDAVRRRLPEDQRRYLLNIPYLARENTADDLHALRRAWAPTDEH